MSHAHFSSKSGFKDFYEKSKYQDMQNAGQPQQRKLYHIFHNQPKIGLGVGFVLCCSSIQFHLGFAA